MFEFIAKNRGIYEHKRVNKHGMCMGCVWGVYGMCMGCVWGVYGVKWLMVVFMEIGLSLSLFSPPSLSLAIYIYIYIYIYKILVIGNHHL